MIKIASIFSPEINLTNTNGEASVKKISSSNHFALMLKSFIENTKSPEKREKEIKRFIKLASLIKNFKEASNLKQIKK